MYEIQAKYRLDFQEGEWFTFYSSESKEKVRDKVKDLVKRFDVIFPFYKLIPINKKPVGSQHFVSLRIVYVEEISIIELEVFLNGHK